MILHRVLNLGDQWLEISVGFSWRRVWLGWWWEQHPSEWQLDVGLGPLSIVAFHVRPLARRRHR